MAIVTLTTDFGLRDHYVAVMKAVVLRAAPRTVLIDVTHEVPKFNTVHAAIILRQLVEWYPPKTVHLIVVDPGVGSRRAALAFRYNGQYVVGPDNGLITLVHRAFSFEAARKIENVNYPSGRLSPTFHGRDIMAPAAAHLASGGSLEQLGPPSDRLELLDMAQPYLDAAGAVHGEIIYVDSFGNLISNIHRSDLTHANTPRHTSEVYLNDAPVGPMRSTYNDVPLGHGLALFGSSNMLEVAVNQGSARDKYEASTGSTVVVK